MTDYNEQARNKLADEYQNNGWPVRAANLRKNVDLPLSDRMAVSAIARVLDPNNGSDITTRKDA
jgi:hypothetical protein